MSVVFIKDIIDIFLNTIETNSSAKESRVKMRRDLGPSIILGKTSQRRD